ncbi:MAG TPA: hypothetical protein GXX75_09780 [Clostridiales bacterium]|nr:hypothetical protein [Clostridiales bacterium]
MKAGILEYKNRCLRTRCGKLLMGPSGNRLFVDYLDRYPGFRGRIDFIHKVNLGEIFSVSCEELSDKFDYMQSVWHPEYLEVSLDECNIHFHEIKFITQDDCAVSIQHWENAGRKPVRLILSYEPDQCQVFKGEKKVVSPAIVHGYQFYYCVESNTFSQEDSYILKEKECTDIITVAAFGVAGKDAEGPLMDRAATLCRLSAGDLLEKHCAQYHSFYENIPEFTCSDRALNAAWDYRWYILHNTYAVPDYGNYKHGLMYEGRDHKMGKDPFHPTGWEFTKLIPLSTPLHMTDMRWNGKPDYVKEMIRSLLDSMDEEGELRVMLADDFGNSYCNYSIWAIYQYYLIHPDEDFLRQIISRLKKYADCLPGKYTDGTDLLQIVKVHQLTGKEYQPSYWYFHNFPKDYQGKETYTFLKRVDSSIYFYLNLLGLSYLCNEAEDPDAKKYLEMAEKLKNEINDKMWDDESAFFYDLHFETEEKAYVKNIVGFYPWWADIVPEINHKGFATLFSDEFETEYMFPSVSRKCPAYAPNGGWMGDFIKGRDGCVWDGPSWPYTNAILIDALGRQSQKNNHCYDKEFARKLRKYTLQHFRNGNIEEPYLVEHYNPETGEPLSDEVDYNHSFFLDLVMKYVVGIQVFRDKVVLDPLDIGLDSFVCNNVNIRGHKLDISYTREEGFRVRCDEKEMINKKELAYSIICL